LADRCILRVEQYVTWAGEGLKGRIVTILTGKHQSKTTAPLKWVHNNQIPYQIYDGRPVEIIRQLGLLTPDDVKSRPGLKPVSLKPEPKWVTSNEPHL
jgi:hypothetical protein